MHVGVRVVHGVVRRRGRDAGLVTAEELVDEAVALADRVLVMRDGAIASEYAVSPEANARRTHPDATALREALLAELGVAADSVPA